MKIELWSVEIIHKYEIFLHIKSIFNIEWVWQMDSLQATWLVANGWKTLENIFGFDLGKVLWPIENHNWMENMEFWSVSMGADWRGWGLKNAWHYKTK